MTNQYSAPPVVVSDSQNGWDRTVVYADGRTRRMRNFYLPIPNDDPNKGYLVRIYHFGSAMDPYGTGDYAYKGVHLVDDYRSGNDRVSVYSDGTAYTSAGWYERNPQYANFALAPGNYAPTPILTYVAPILPAVLPSPMPSQAQNSVLNVPRASYPTGPVSETDRLPAPGPVGQDPAYTTLPTDVTIPYEGNTPFMGPVAAPPLAPTQLPGLANGGQVPAAVDSYAPGAPFVFYPPNATDANDPEVRTILPYPTPPYGWNLPQPVGGTPVPVADPNANWNLPPFPGVTSSPTSLLIAAVAIYLLIR